MEKRIKKLELEVQCLAETVNRLIQKVDPDGYKIAKQISEGDMSGFMDKIKETIKNKFRDLDNNNTEPDKRW